MIVEVRDEQWLVTHSTKSQDGWKVKVRGISDYVRDTTATFYSALDEITVFDPTDVIFTPDTTGNYQRTRLQLEAALRQTPVPLYQPELSVATKMLLDPLDYQLDAVRKALSEDNIRPRILLADAVGLGKTLEIGMILSELVRRGRGERILIVTPKHVLEQFQQEMWTRFALPFVRLDSQGIQKVRQKLPASRNPFTYFPRVIVSMDTLKSAKYRAQLEKVTWDAVVIDEIHNATNLGTQNNQLARTLAPTTEALILASATPHNGDPESFREIMRLLDPTSVLPNGEIDTNAAKRLIIRRHRNSPEVAQVVGAQWAKRGEPQNIAVKASAEENAIAEELYATWTNSPSGPPCSDTLFPWTLVKAFLSSPKALQETVEGRLKRRNDAPSASTQHERDALQKLLSLAEATTAEKSEKFAALVDYLQTIGVRKGSDIRAVVFSERVATLNWLKQNLEKYLKLPKGAIRVMHGGLSDTEQMELVDEFRREDTPLRILVTGDVASEGVNLHAKCHHLVHYDIPWSLIRIQQRNGRIDRYGQQHEPQIAALILDPQDTNFPGEMKVLARLIEREHAANKLLGEAALLMGKHNVRGEEDVIRSILQKSRDFDQQILTPEQVLENATHTVGVALDIAQLMAAMPTASATEQPATNAPSSEHPQTQITSLFATEKDFLTSALTEAFEQATAPLAKNGVALEYEKEHHILSFKPPKDLQRRLDFLPQDYVQHRKVKEKILLSTTPSRAQELIKAALQTGSEHSWPSAHFLGPLHPVTAWATERALAKFPRRELPAIVGNVEELTLLMMATVTNSLGQIVSRSFLTASPAQFELAHIEPLEDPYTWLYHVGLGTTASNSQLAQVPEDIGTFLSIAISGAESHTDFVIDAATIHANHRIEIWKQRQQEWENQRKGITHASQTLKKTSDLIERERKLLNTLSPERQLIRPLVLITPNAPHRKNLI
nr:DEAD/DEAH box helicase [Corynebacterium freiburgense]